MGTLADAGIPTQIAVVVSRKVSRKAVERNRVKRRIRAAIALLLPQMLPHHWVAVYARSAMLTCSWEQLLKELSGLLRKAGLLTSDHQGGVSGS
jgi:ribonuclease P protein component